MDGAIERHLPRLQRVVVPEPRGRRKEGPREDPKDVGGAIHQERLSRVDAGVAESAREARRSRDADALGDGGPTPSALPEPLEEPRRKRRPERGGGDAEGP